jgi:hypothetical protein
MEMEQQIGCNRLMTHERIAHGEDLARYVLVTDPVRLFQLEIFFDRELALSAIGQRGFFDSRGKHRRIQHPVYELFALDSGEFLNRLPDPLNVSLSGGHELAPTSVLTGAV